MKKAFVLGCFIFCSTVWALSQCTPAKMDKITAAEAEIVAAAKAGETPLRSLTKAQAHALASDAIECEIATLEAMRSHPLSSEMSKDEILTQLTAEEGAILRCGEVALSATLRVARLTAAECRK